MVGGIVDTLEGQRGPRSLPSAVRLRRPHPDDLRAPASWNRATISWNSLYLLLRFRGVTRIGREESDAM